MLICVSMELREWRGSKARSKEEIGRKRDVPRYTGPITHRLPAHRNLILPSYLSLSPSCPDLPSPSSSSSPPSPSLILIQRSPHPASFEWSDRVRPCHCVAVPSPLRPALQLLLLEDERVEGEIEREWEIEGQRDEVQGRRESSTSAL